MDQSAKRAPPASQPKDGQPPAGQPSYFTGLTPAEHLMLTPIADWPASALATARQFIETPAGLAALRGKPHKKVWLAGWVAVREGF